MGNPGGKRLGDWEEGAWSWGHMAREHLRWGSDVKVLRQPSKWRALHIDLGPTMDHGAAGT